MQAYAEGGENGAKKDYIKWALKVSSVTRAWCHTNGFGSGSVVVYVMLDNASGNGCPVGTDGASSQEKRYKTASGDQLRVVDALYSLQPVTALIIVCSPIKQPVDFIIGDLGNNNTPEIQQSIKNTLEEVFRENSAPRGKVYPSAWNSALDALGLAHYSVLAPTAPVTAHDIGHIPDLGTVTFTSA